MPQTFCFSLSFPCLLYCHGLKPFVCLGFGVWGLGFGVWGSGARGPRDHNFGPISNEVSGATRDRQSVVDK